MKKIGMFLAAMALIATFVTGCGGSASSSKSSDTAAATASESGPAEVAGPTITIANMAFGEPLTVAPGTQINIVNNDSVEHSVTSDTAGAFDQDVDGHEKATFKAPSQPGDYPFHCSYHPKMKGTLTVK
jgi:plastocyanin